VTKNQALKQYLYAKYNFENPLPENWQSVCDELANALHRAIEANESAVGFLEELSVEIESKIDSLTD